MTLQNRTAIVTGAAGGIGMAIARRLLRDGANVILADFDEGRLASASAELGKEVDPACVATSRCDVAAEGDVAAPSTPRCSASAASTSSSTTQA